MLETWLRACAKLEHIFRFHYVRTPKYGKLAANANRTVKAAIQFRLPVEAQHFHLDMTT